MAPGPLGPPCVLDAGLARTPVGLPGCLRGAPPCRPGSTPALGRRPEPQGPRRGGNATQAGRPISTFSVVLGQRDGAPAASDFGDQAPAQFRARAPGLSQPLPQAEQRPEGRSEPPVWRAGSPRSLIPFAQTLKLERTRATGFQTRPRLTASRCAWARPAGPSGADGRGSGQGVAFSFNWEASRDTSAVCPRVPALSPGVPLPTVAPVSECAQPLCAALGLDLQVRPALWAGHLPQAEGCFISGP